MTNPTTAELVENAADSLRHGVAHYLTRSDSPTAIKHAILNIYHGIELFLKARISQAHPLLIYRSLDRRVAPDSQTVGLAEIIIRLENLGMALGATQGRFLVELQRKRNRIEHFTFQASADHENAVGQALKFLLEFLPALGTSLEDLVEDTEDYHKLLQAILSYEELLAKAVADAATAGGRVARCLECGERTVSVQSGSGYCHLCHADTTYERCEGCGEELPESELEELGLCEACLERAFGS